MSISKSDLLSNAKGGAMAGIVGGIALVALIFGIDSQLGVHSGTFYKMIGLLTGLEGMNAIVVGFLAHMATAALIGATFFVCSTLHRILNITSFQKGVFAGGITGLEVFAIFFFPINQFIMMPAVEEIVIFSDRYDLSIKEVEAMRTVLANIDQILWGSLLMHVLYGVVMGYFAGAMLPGNYKTSKIHTE